MIFTQKTWTITILCSWAYFILLFPITGSTFVRFDKQTIVFLQRSSCCCFILWTFLYWECFHYYWLYRSKHFLDNKLLIIVYCLGNVDTMLLIPFELKRVFYCLNYYFSLVEFLFYFPSYKSNFPYTFSGLRRLKDRQVFKSRYVFPSNRSNCSAIHSQCLLLSPTRLSF